MKFDKQVRRVARWLASADHILVFSGSGFSAESGVPTFRGTGGLYDDPDILRYAHRDALEEEPEEALAWIEGLRGRLTGYEPNPGHRALARICRDHACTIATQNIDGLLEDAFEDEGLSTDCIWHIHGTLKEARCLDCNEPAEVPDDYTQARCDKCGGYLRPNVVLFGEMLPEEPFARAQEAARKADVVLLLGTSGIVHPAAALPGLARSHGAKLVEINPNETELSDICDVVIRGKTGEVLPEVLEAMG
ncbi:MAG: SIR2 family NAD-dependent protein deacylase [Persicimonas sp.]